MPLFHVRFEKVCEIVLEAESQDEAEEAAERAADEGLTNWDVDDWDAQVTRVAPPKRVPATAAELPKADHGLIDGEIFAICDVRKHEAEQEADRQWRMRHGLLTEEPAVQPVPVHPDQIPLPLGGK